MTDSKLEKFKDDRARKRKAHDDAGRRLMKCYVPKDLYDMVGEAQFALGLRDRQSTVAHILAEWQQNNFNEEAMR